MAINLTNNDIPAGWQLCRLPDFACIVMGQSPSSETYNHEGSGIPFFQGKAEFGEVYPRIDKYCSRPNKIANAGATLLSVRAPVGPTNLAKIDCCIGRGLAAIHSLGGIEPKFILYLFRSIEPTISGRGTGSTFNAINKTFVEELKFALPPLNQQVRIVAKIDELFSELDKGVESLKAARERLKVYRQAVLKHAFEGKLTEQWREENKHKLETPEQVLTQIRTDRDRYYQQQVKEWDVAVRTWEAKAKKEKKPIKPRKITPLTQLQDDVRTILPDIPASWTWGKVAWMTCGVEYGTSAKSSKSGNMPVIRMGNLQNGEINWDDLVFTSDDEEIEKYSLAFGDVLFNRTNSPELVGKTAIYRGERPALFAGYLIRVNHIQALVDSHYLNLFLNSSLAKQYGNSVKTDGVNQSNINGEKLKDYPFPYCSLAEQKEIVRILDEKLSLSGHLLNGIDSELAKSSTLRQSILKMAFSGQLVEQEPNDEPASVLLERIRAEKTEQEKVYGKKSRRKSGDVTV